jgi:hypothetical protein
LHFTAIRLSANRLQFSTSMPPNHSDHSSLMTPIDVDVNGSSTAGRGGKRKLSDYNPSGNFGGTSESSMGHVDYSCMESSLRRLEHSSSRGGLDVEHAARFYASTLLEDPQQFLLPRLEGSYWKQLSTTAKELIGGCLQELLNTTQKSSNTRSFWKFIGLTRDLPVFLCPTTQLQFTLIVGGNYRMGISRSLQEQLHRCLLEHFQVAALNQVPLESFKKVQHEVLQQLLLVQHNQQQQTSMETNVTTSCAVAPFLLATTPISIHQARLALSFDDQENSALPNNHSAGATCTSRAPTCGRNFRFPTETEWEYAARGGGWEMLFPYSCQIDDKQVWNGDQQLSHIGPRNAMGLHQVGVRPELCTRGVEPTKVVARAGADVWSLIYHARPAAIMSPLGVLEGDDDDDDDMMEDISGNEEVVRLAMDIFSGPSDAGTIGEFHF